MRVGMLARGAVLAAAAWLLVATAQAQTKLTVYTALEPEQIEAYRKSFEAEAPGIELSFVRDTSGGLAARLAAPKDAARADVVWGVSATALTQLTGQGLLEPYAPAGLETLAPTFRNPADPPDWVGMDAHAATICFDTAAADKKKLPAPKTWKDLVDPRYRGEIAMPNPAVSDTGFMIVAAWLQQMGEEAGWKFMDALHANIAVYTRAGSRPCRQVGAGKYVIGLSTDTRAASVKAKVATVDLIWPGEGLGWEIQGSAIVRGTPNLAAAQKFLDWSVSPAAMTLYAADAVMLAGPRSAPPLPFMPDDLEGKLAKMDLTWMAQNRARILAEWTKRYDSKSEPR